MGDEVVDDDVDLDMNDGEENRDGWLGWLRECVEAKERREEARQHTHTDNAGKGVSPDLGRETESAENTPPASLIAGCCFLTRTAGFIG